MPLRLGMLGMWHTHAHGIVRQVAEHPDEFRLVGFWDPEPEVVTDRSGAWRERLPDFKVHGRPQDVLGEKLDGVVVEGRVHDNLKWARLALEAGYPVLLEKPAGDDLAAFRSLIELAQRKHLHLQLIYLFRYMTATLELLKRARQGDLGRIYEFRARLPKDLPSYSRYVEELGRYPGGMFFEMAGHIIDLCLTLLGRPKAVTPFLAHHHVEPGSFVDNGLAVLEFERAWGIVEVPALEVTSDRRRIEVYGTGGAFTIPHLGSGHLANKTVQPVEYYRAGAAAWECAELPAATLQIADLREFAACVGRRKEPDYGIEHDLAVQETLLRASRMA